MRLANTRSIRTLLLAGAGLATLMTLASPAAAQWYGRPLFYSSPPVIVEEDNLSAREIAAIVRRMGYSDVSRPRFAGDEFLVDATTRAGTRVRLVLDAFTGHLIDSYLAPEAAPRRVARIEEPRRRVVPAEPQRSPPAGEGESPQLAPRPPQAVAPPRATPSAPTVVRREPLLPPQAPIQTAPPATVIPPVQRREIPQAQPQRPQPRQPSAQAPAGSPPAGVGTGTRQQPRLIPGAPPPPAVLDDAERSRRDDAPLNSVPPVGME